MSGTTTIRPNVFETIVIGTQTWMKYNYNFGGYYYNGDVSYVNVYGKLYTYVQANSISITGWHLPSLTDWNTLITYLGGSTVAGGVVKESGTTHWTAPNTGATNSSGFAAVPAGSKNPNNDLCGWIGEYCFFWTSTEVDTTTANYVSLAYDNDDFLALSNGVKLSGMSVRLIKD